jgi:hypothetical protein
MKNQDCHICNNIKEDGFELCANCIQHTIRVCTCNKKFITEKPHEVIMGNLDYEHSMIVPDQIPNFFLTHIRGNLYHILGCRGCKASVAKKEISIQENFEAALQASIVSCVYQKVEEDDSEPFYEYLSDSLDPEFEAYLAEKGVVVGMPTGIELLPDTDIVNNTSDMEKSFSQIN